MIEDTDLLIAEVKRKGIRAFNLEGAIDRYSMLKDQRDKKIDSWAIRWAATVFLNDGVALYPGKSLVRNIGFDGSGVHCGKTDIAQSEFLDFRVNSFPTDFVECESSAKALIRYHREEKNLFSKLVRVLKKVY